MGKVVKKICLTGGPCAGKSTSLDLIYKYLTDKGYITYIVNESATELINSGIKLFGDNAMDLLLFQDTIVKYQLYKEKLIDDIVSNLDIEKDIIILYDRAIIDNKAYISQDLFNHLLSKYNLNEAYELNKFDMVIYLESAAKGVGYTKENNRARIEDRELAIVMDDKILKAWENHSNLIKVKSFENFIDKQKVIIEVLDNYLSKDTKLLIKKYTS